MHPDPSQTCSADPSPTCTTTDEAGATAVEYGLMIALVSAIIATSVATLGNDVVAAFNLLIGAF